jgi:hypothetical protein
MVSPQCFRSSNCCERIEQVVEDLPNHSFLRSHRSVDTVRLIDWPVLTDHPFVDGRPY